MNTIAIIALSLFPISVLGGEFKNWFFDLHAKECVISGQILSPEDEEIGSFSGKSTGKMSPDGTKFTTSFDYVYLPRGNKEVYSLVWTKGEDGIYRSSSDELAKSKYSCELVVEARRYHLKTIFEDGTVVTTEGILGKDNITRSNDKARNKDGEIIGKMKYTQSALNKDNKKEGQQAAPSNR